MRLANTRADQLVADADVYSTADRTVQYFNLNAFAKPTPGQFGTGHINYIGPSQMDINMALTRRFQVTEGQTVEFRAEAFNLPNRLNANDPNTTVGNVNFGKTLTAKDPRIIQVALKYVF